MILGQSLLTKERLVKFPEGKPACGSSCNDSLWILYHSYVLKNPLSGVSHNCTLNLDAPFIKVINYQAYVCNPNIQKLKKEDQVEATLTT